MTDFTLIETMRHEPALADRAGTDGSGGTGGIVRLRLHLARLARSARRLGFTVPPDLLARLDQAVAGATGPLRVRLELARDGQVTLTAVPFTPMAKATVWRVRLAQTRLSSQDGLLRYKTSRRGPYEAARGEWTAAEADEVLLLNEEGLPCEGTITSLFLDDGSGMLKTPPIACGLLAGVLRTEMICTRRARVERLTVGSLAAGTLYMGNSLRGLIPAVLLPPVACKTVPIEAGSLL
jgi:4-amino-4-deoxychorismate lyase